MDAKGVIGCSERRLDKVSNVTISGITRPNSGDRYVWTPEKLIPDVEDHFPCRIITECARSGTLITSILLGRGSQVDMRTCMIHPPSFYEVDHFS